MVKEVKNEGHFFIWQTILYPFAKLHLYPYAMQIINWIFCIIALIIMWQKAPFNNVIKVLITFSFPFLGCYGVLARCYSIGILCLFLLAAMYEKRLEYPKTYALLLIICANTSVMAMIGASAFGFLFLYDLLSKKSLSKKTNVFVGLILSFGVILILAQLLNIDYFMAITSNRRPHISIKIFRNVFVYKNLFLNLFLITIFSVPIVKYFWKFKLSLIFFGYTYFLLLMFTMAVYGGYFWHSYFFYIYLIISMWICQRCLVDESFVKKAAVCILGAVSIILIFHKPTVSEYFFVYGSLRAKTFMGYVENDELLKKSQIIQNDGLLMEALPYFSAKNLKIRTHCNNEIISEYSLLNGDDKFCAVKRTIEQAKREPETIKKIVESYKGSTYTYIDSVDYVTQRTFYNIPADGYSIYFEKYKCYDRYCFWRIEIKYENK